MHKRRVMSRKRTQRKAEALGYYSRDSHLAASQFTGEAATDRLSNAESSRSQELEPDA
jgi:hypothetical protein